MKISILFVLLFIVASSLGNVTTLGIAIALLAIISALIAVLYSELQTERELS